MVVLSLLIFYSLAWDTSGFGPSFPLRVRSPSKSLSANIQPRQYVYLLASTSASDDVSSSTTFPSEEDEPTATTRDVSSETIHFNNKLMTLSQNFDRKTAEKVEERVLAALDDVFNHPEDDGGTDDGVIRPNVVSFTAVCNAWARSTLPHAAQKAEKMLNRTIDLWREGYEAARPNAYTFNAVITAWSRSRDRNAADRAVRLLDAMNDLYEEAGRPDDLEPDARCYNLAINAVARSRLPGCADRARALLTKMEYLHDVGPYLELVPDALTFGAIINAYANDRNDREASDKAADLLQQMESMYQMGVTNCKPNTFVYNSCLNAFAKAGGPANAKKAELFLEVMENLSEAGVDDGIKPDAISYSTVINAYANSGWRDAGEKADIILKKMKTLDVTGDENVKCNAISYTAAVKAWVNSAKVAAKQCRDDEGNEEATFIQHAATRAWDIFVECALLHLAGDRKCQPSHATYDLAKEAFKLAGNKEGGEMVEDVRRRIDAKSGGRRGGGGRNTRTSRARKH